MFLSLILFSRRSAFDFGRPSNLYRKYQYCRKETRSFGSEGEGQGEGLAVRNLKLKCRERWQSQLVLGTLDRITGIDDLSINEIVTNQPTRHGKKSTRRQATHHPEVNSLPANDSYPLTFHTYVNVSFISQLLVGGELVSSESTS